MTEMGLEGLNSRKLNIWGQNDVALAFLGPKQRTRGFFFFLKTQGTTQSNVVLVYLKRKKKYKTKTMLFSSLLQIKCPRASLHSPTTKKVKISKVRHLGPKWRIRGFF